MMRRPIDRTKQSNCVCKNCRAWSWFKVAYDDDKQVVTILVMKRYDVTPRVDVEISEV